MFPAIWQIILSESESGHDINLWNLQKSNMNKRPSASSSFIISECTYHIWITNNSTALKKWDFYHSPLQILVSFSSLLFYWQWTELALYICQTMELEHVSRNVSPPQMELLKEVDSALVCMTGNSEMKWESFWLSFLVSSPHGKNWIEKALFLCSYMFCFE